MSVVFVDWGQVLVSWSKSRVIQGLGVLVVLSMLVSIGWWYWPYTGSSAEQIYSVVNQKNKDQAAFLVFYRSSCKDCQSVKRTIRWAGIRAEREGQKVVYIATNLKRNGEWIRRYSVTKTPTIVALKKDGHVSRYTDANRTGINNFFRSGGASNDQDER